MVPRIVGAFFALAAALVTTAAITILFPGGPLDAIWVVKPAPSRRFGNFRP